MKFLTVILMMCFGFIMHAQEINYNGTIYTVKGDSILKEGVDVTYKLSAEEQQQIKSAFNEKKLLEKASEKKGKELKKAEKKQKQAEKKQRKAEKALKQKQKAQSNFDKSAKKHKQAIAKYDRLKNKGKLSPEDEAKWLKKIEKLNEAHKKAQKRLKRV